ncbi:MAG: hypothetical protein QW478_01795 [Candidatus Micrarchaeaceae archaeon]
MEKENPQYYIQKKFNDGWLIKELNSEKVLFITNEQLKELGIINKRTKEQRDEKSQIIFVNHK